MKTRSPGPASAGPAARSTSGKLAQESRDAFQQTVFPTADELAALRAWYAGLTARQAAERYLGKQRASGQSSRALLTAIRRQLADFAGSRQLHALVDLFVHPASERLSRAKDVLASIEALKGAPVPLPKLTDPISHWLGVRAATALQAQGIKSMADLAVRIPRQRRWWADLSGVGVRQAAEIEHFFASHPQLTDRSCEALPVIRSEALPWEQLVVPIDVDGSCGTFRAPRATCVLHANNDYEAVQAWLSLHESPATQRAYRKEAERLILWAILQKGRALSSLTTEDALEYRQFVRRPTPPERWIGPARPRSSSEWRPFQGALSTRSTAYALSVINAMFRWLIEHRYVLANPFSGIKVRGGKGAKTLDASRGFSEHEWSLVREAAQGIEWTGNWTEQGASRLLFVLDFWYATGLRPSEFVDARLGAVHRDDHGDDWLMVTGKGSKEGQVAMPLFALSALERYLMRRGLPTTRLRWDPKTPLIPSLEEDGDGITTTRLRAVMRRFFLQAAEQLQEASPTTAEKLRRATPHWLRHTHATHALARGVELTSVRDNLRHASVATTSIYLHTDQVKRARQMREAFPST